MTIKQQVIKAIQEMDQDVTFDEIVAHLNDLRHQVQQSSNRE